jgi:glycosyltransferase involved in cell wall biosynthesis
MSGDLWAGAESQVHTLIRALSGSTDVKLAAIILNDGELARRLRKLGIDVTVLSEQLLSPARLLLGMRAQMLHWRPDIVHTHRMKENVLGSIANRLALGVPSIRTVHGLDEHDLHGFVGLVRRVARGLDQWCGAHLQRKVIAVSEDLALRLADGFPRGHVVVIENGVDILAIQSERRTSDFRIHLPDAIHVGFAGRLTSVKRPDLFLETAATLVRLRPCLDLRFHLFGDGPLMGDLVTTAERLGLNSVVHFHGHRDDMASCIASLNALLICSDHEGLPMVALESLAVRTPVVAHAVGGLPRLLEGKSRSVLVYGHDATDYASGILRALEVARDFQLLTLDENTEKKISSRTNAARTLDLYRSVLSD